MKQQRKETEERRKPRGKGIKKKPKMVEMRKGRARTCRSGPAPRRGDSLILVHSREGKGKQDGQTNRHELGQGKKAQKGSSTASISLFISSLRILFSLSQRSSWAATSSASNLVFITWGPPKHWLILGGAQFGENHLPHPTLPKWFVFQRAGLPDSYSCQSSPHSS